MIDDERDARRAGAARLVLVTSVVVYVAVAMTVVVAGPDEVVGRFAVNGQPDRLDATGPFVLTLSLTVLGLVAIFAATPALVRRIPIAHVNVPNRERWNTPERRRVLARRVGADMNRIAAASVALMTAALIISALGGLGVVLPGWVFPVLLVTYITVIATIVIDMRRGRRYEPPATA